MEPIGPEEMGRNAGKVESVEDMISHLESRAAEFGLAQRGYDSRGRSASTTVGPLDAAGCVVGRSSHESYTTSKPIERHRLSF